MAVRTKRRPMRRSTRGSLAEQKMLALFAASGLPPPEREVRIVPDRLFRFDFVWMQSRLAVELHGATFTHGRHVSGRGFNLDREKHRLAVLAGYRCLEYTTRDLRVRPQTIVKEVRALLESAAK